MKTKEELNRLKDAVASMEKRLADGNESGKSEETAALDKELTELNEEELSEVSAGTAFTAGTYSFTNLIHNNCGGVIHNVGNPFSSCYCDKCGETHYWHFSFDYTEVPIE